MTEIHPVTIMSHNEVENFGWFAFNVGLLCGVSVMLLIASLRKIGWMPDLYQLMLGLL